MFLMTCCLSRLLSLLPELQMAAHNEEPIDIDGKDDWVAKPDDQIDIVDYAQRSSNPYGPPLEPRPFSQTAGLIRVDKIIQMTMEDLHIWRNRLVSETLIESNF